MCNGLWKLCINGSVPFALVTSLWLLASDQGSGDRWWKMGHGYRWTTWWTILHYTSLSVDKLLDFTALYITIGGQTAGLYCTVHYYWWTHCWTILYCTAHYRNAQHCIGQHCTVLCHTLLNCNRLYFTLHYTALHCKCCREGWSPIHWWTYN